MFFLWASFVVLATQGFNITTNLGNTIQYIGKIILTSDGSSQGSTGIILDGTHGNAFFSGNVGISWSISATIWFINNFSATIWSIGNLSVTTWSIGYFSATTWSIGNLVTQNINAQSINGNGISLSNTNTRLGLNCATDDCYSEILFSTEAFGNTFFIGTNELDAGNYIHWITNWPMIFSTNNIERMRIAANGNLNINNNLSVAGNLGIGTWISSSYAITVSGDVLLYKDIITKGNQYVQGNLVVTGDVSIGTLNSSIKMKDSTNHGKALNIFWSDSLTPWYAWGSIYLYPGLGGDQNPGGGGNIYLLRDRDQSSDGKLAIWTWVVGTSLVTIDGDITTHGAGTFNDITVKTGTFDDVTVKNWIFKMTTISWTSVACSALSQRLFLWDSYSSSPNGTYWYIPWNVATRDTIYIVHAPDMEWTMSYVSSDGTIGAYLWYTDLHQYSTIFLPKGYAILFECWAWWSVFYYSKIMSN